MLTHFYWADVRHLSNLLFKSSSDLEADTEGEGQGDDDEEPGDGGQQPPAHPDAGLRLLACTVTCHVLRVSLTCLHSSLELEKGPSEGL